MTTSHLRGKVCYDISWVVLTQSLVIWWKKMERGQATIGDCCARASFSSVIPRQEFRLHKLLANYRFWFKTFVVCLKDTDSVTSCASPASTSKQTSNVSLNVEAPDRWNSSYWPYCHRANVHSARWHKPSAPDSLADPNALPMGASTPWCCYRSLPSSKS